jgi:hypothetical protein
VRGVSATSVLTIAWDKGSRDVPYLSEVIQEVVDDERAQEAYGAACYAYAVATAKDRHRTREIRDAKGEALDKLLDEHEKAKQLRKEARMQMIETVTPEPFTRNWYPDPGHWVVWCVYVAPRSQRASRLGMDHFFIRRVLQHLDGALDLAYQPRCTFSANVAYAGESAAYLSFMYSELKQKPNIVVLWSTADKSAVESLVPFLRAIPVSIQFLPILVMEVNAWERVTSEKERVRGFSMAPVIGITWDKKRRDVPYLSEAMREAVEDERAQVAYDDAYRACAETTPEYWSHWSHAREIKEEKRKALDALLMIHAKERKRRDVERRETRATYVPDHGNRENTDKKDKGSRSTSTPRQLVTACAVAAITIAQFLYSKKDLVSMFVPESKVASPSFSGENVSSSNESYVPGFVSESRVESPPLDPGNVSSPNEYHAPTFPENKAVTPPIGSGNVSSSTAARAPTRSESKGVAFPLGHTNVVSPNEAHTPMRSESKAVALPLGRMNVVSPNDDSVSRLVSESKAVTLPLGPSNVNHRNDDSVSGLVSDSKAVALPRGQIDVNSTDEDWFTLDEDVAHADTDGDADFEEFWRDCEVKWKRSRKGEDRLILEEEFLRSQWEKHQLWEEHKLLPGYRDPWPIYHPVNEDSVSSLVSDSKAVALPLHHKNVDSTDEYWFTWDVNMDSTDEEWEEFWRRTSSKLDVCVMKKIVSSWKKNSCSPGGRSISCGWSTSSPQDPRIHGRYTTPLVGIPVTV